jgi:hypothetical protein
VRDDSPIGETRPFYKFDKPGTLRPPGPIGRLVRLGLGMLLMWLVYQLVFRSGAEDLTHVSFYVWVLFALWLFPAVINIGFGRIWHNWPPRIAIVFVGLAAAGASYLVYDAIAGPPLWWIVVPWMVYTFGHLGISFVLAAILSTPGCEMRAIPHLMGRISGRPRAEHYCPGFLDGLDRWEAQKVRVSR